MTPQEAIVQAGARALAQQIDDVPWVRLSIADQSERVLAVQAVLKAVGTHLRAGVYLEVSQALPGNSQAVREIRDWLRGRAKAALSTISVPPK